VKCIDCARLSLRTGNADLARQGFGRCALEGVPARYVAAQFERQCDEFERGANGAARRAWLVAQSGAPPPTAAPEPATQSGASSSASATE
jgi:hypothetical protein